VTVAGFRPFGAGFAIHDLPTAVHFAVQLSLSCSQQGEQTEDQQQGVQDLHGGRLPFSR